MARLQTRTRDQPTRDPRATRASAWRALSRGPRSGATKELPRTSSARTLTPEELGEQSREVRESGGRGCAGHEDALHRERDCDDGENSGRRPASCQRGGLGVARRELSVVVPQPEIVTFVINRVTDESLPVEDIDNGATAVMPSREVMNAVAEATGDRFREIDVVELPLIPFLYANRLLHSRQLSGIGRYAPVAKGPPIPKERWSEVAAQVQREGLRAIAWELDVSQETVRLMVTQVRAETRVSSHNRCAPGSRPPSGRTRALPGDSGSVCPETGCGWVH
jgi:hypothetical protein